MNPYKFLMLSESKHKFLVLKMIKLIKIAIFAKTALQ